MARIKVILYKGARITANGCGYNMAGDFFADWKDAVQILRHEDGEEPLTAEQLAEIEESVGERHIQERESTNERVAEMRMRQI